MYRTRTCGDLHLADEGLVVTLAGWVQRTRKMGGMTFVDLRDRYGITQLVFNQELDASLCEQANKLGREYVIQVTGTVRERSNKNPNLATGDIELEVSKLNVLNTAVTPPFTIEDDTDGGDDLRMKYRYLDLRRTCVRKNLELRHRMAFEVRNYLDKQGFLEVETPVLVNSTPEGARDFVVPSRMNPGQFYALPQSPQTLKQLLMVSGFDRYFQIVKCFRDEDLRADRQPEFTQIDCEMSFVEQEDVLQLFEGMAKHLFKVIRGIDFKEPFLRMTWQDAMKYYGSDKPDLRFGMKFVELMDIMQGHGFSVFDNAKYIGGICAEGAATYTRKQLDALTEFVKRPQIGAKGMVYARVESDGNVKSSVDKFYTQEVLQQMKEAFGAKPGDLILILSGDDAMKTRKQLSELRLHVADQLGLRDKDQFACLWVIDFPLFEWSEEDQRYYAMHHPFTSPNPEDIPLLLKANIDHPGTLIVGERKYTEEMERSGGSKFANRFSNFWFAVQTGCCLKDTQTGYRLYPLKKLCCLSLLSSRYEAELGLMVLASWHGIELAGVGVNVYYPPKNERVSHFRPGKDFVRIFAMNMLLCVLALVYGWPLRLFRLTAKVFRTFYTLFFFVLASAFVLSPLLFLYAHVWKMSENGRCKLHSIITAMASCG